ncbi:hypothetical protein C8J57DRAFT_1635676 [Mycena rebaudengoi]|nr:hypothetical protein C8J57DRAFT_1635676 [Mycena rebaudengoi]
MSTDPFATTSPCREFSGGLTPDLAIYISDPSFAGMFNPDMMGFAVRLSSFVLNICSGILIAWGAKADADTALTALLVQMGSVVLCTHIGIIRGQLSFFDGFFALSIVHSPIAWYIIWTNLPHLYYWIRGDKKMQSWNSILIVVLLSGWISLHALLWTKGRKFPGEDCGSMSAGTYFYNVMLSGILSSISPNDNFDFWWLLVYYPLCAIHHWRRGSFALAKRKGLSLSLSVVAAIPTMVVTLRMLLALSTPLKRVGRGVAYLALDLLFSLFGSFRNFRAPSRLVGAAPSHPFSRPAGSTHTESIPLSADPVSPTSRLEVERADSLDITVEHANSLADDHDPFESTHLPSRLGWITPLSEYPSSYTDILLPRSTSPVEMHALRGATPPPQRLPDHGQPDLDSNTAVSDSESSQGSGQPSSNLGTTARSSWMDPALSYSGTTRQRKVGSKDVYGHSANATDNSTTATTGID